MAINCFLSSYWPGCLRCSCKYVQFLLLGFKSLTLNKILASRLGCVTGLGMFFFFFRNEATCMWLTSLFSDLASHCRLLLHDRPKHKLLYRWLVLYPLYVLSEIAIISTDLAELLGSAIALCMIFPKLPLWAGVLLTAFDVLVLLALRDPLRGRPVRMFECLIAALVSYMVYISDTNPLKRGLLGTFGSDLHCNHHRQH
jgi:hypothetical protein